MMSNDTRAIYGCGGDPIDDDRADEHAMLCATISKYILECNEWQEAYNNQRQIIEDELRPRIEALRSTVAHLRNRLAKSTNVKFSCAGKEYTALQMLTANGDDDAFCEWVINAKPGDFYPDGCGCECVAT